MGSLTTDLPYVELSTDPHGFPSIAVDGRQLTNVQAVSITAGAVGVSDPADPTRTIDHHVPVVRLIEDAGSITFKGKAQIVHVAPPQELTPTSLLLLDHLGGLLDAIDNWLSVLTASPGSAGSPYAAVRTVVDRQIAARKFLEQVNKEIEAGLHGPNKMGGAPTED